MNETVFVEIAKLAEDCGIAALTIHGRTRECLFKGEAEYDSIRTVSSRVFSIPHYCEWRHNDPLKVQSSA